MAIWFLVFSLDQPDMLCMSCWHLCPQFPVQNFEYLDRWFSWCVHFSLFCPKFAVVCFLCCIKWTRILTGKCFWTSCRQTILWVSASMYVFFRQFLVLMGWKPWVYLPSFRFKLSFGMSSVLHKVFVERPLYVSRCFDFEFIDINKQHFWLFYSIFFANLFIKMPKIQFQLQSDR